MVRGVQDVGGYLSSCRAYLNGFFAKGSFEACATIFMFNVYMKMVVWEYLNKWA